MSSDAGKAVAAVVLMASSFGLGLITFMNTFGLHIESWGWFVFGSIGQFVLLAAVTALQE
jgi:hypothetical protein